MFNRLDFNGDKKISFQEFEDAIPLLEKWGVKINDAQKSYNEIDIDASGKVNFDEFCSWAIKKHLDIEDDDDFTNECLRKLK